MSLLHFQFERYDSNHAISQTMLAIRQGTFGGALLSADGRTFLNFRRPSLLGVKTFAGLRLSRGNRNAFCVDVHNPATGNNLTCGVLLSEVADLMTNGEIFIRGGFGNRLHETEQDLARVMSDKEGFEQVMAAALRMETSRRMPFMGVVVVAHDRGIELSMDQVQQFSHLDRDDLLKIGRALDAGTWSSAVNSHEVADCSAGDDLRLD